MIGQGLHRELYQNQRWSTQQRYLVVGDVHGQRDMLMRLAALTEYDPQQDFMICVGDLVDRGPKSAEALRWFAAGTNRLSLLGNHEALMLDSEFTHEADRVWMGNGGNWSHHLDDLEVNLLRRLAAGFPLTVRIHLLNGTKVGVVHAEVKPGTTWRQLQRSRYAVGYAVDDSNLTLTSSLLWGRQRFYCYRFLQEREAPEDINDANRFRITRMLSSVRGVNLVICGHSITPTREPVRFGSHLYIDTGAYEEPDGRLTAVDVSAGVYWQVGHRKGQEWGPRALPKPFNARAYLRKRKQNRSS